MMYRYVAIAVAFVIAVGVLIFKSRINDENENNENGIRGEAIFCKVLDGDKTTLKFRETLGKLDVTAVQFFRS